MNRDRTRGLTFDFLPASFLVPASYFVLQTSDADDSRQFRQVGEWRGFQRYDSTQETRSLRGFRETGGRQAGAWPVVHLEEEEGAGKIRHEYFRVYLMGKFFFYISINPKDLPIDALSNAAIIFIWRINDLFTRKTLLYGSNKL